jgi:hypothetical protein
MRQLAILLSGILATLAASRAARAETLEQLILGGASIETSLFTFDAFAYAPYAGGPDDSLVNVLPIDRGDGFEGLRFAASFSSTGFSQGSIRYRITAKDDGVIAAAVLEGNPSSSPNGFASLDAVFSGGLSPLGIFAQGNASSTSDDTTFAMPTESFTVNSLFRLSGSPGSPTTLTQFEETFRAAPAGLAADFDDDGDVDGADFLIWQRGLRASGGAPAVGDANGDGAVNAADLTIWRNQFGPAGTSPAPIRTVPEPTAMALTWLACISIAAFRRQLQSA